jgi:hypothetical protein
MDSSLEAFVLRLLIVIGSIWLTQFLTTEVFKIEQPARKWILVTVAIIGVLFLIFGARVLKLGL